MRFMLALAPLALLPAAALAQPAEPAAPAVAPPAEQQPAPRQPDIAMGVACATLSQQFGDTYATLTGPTAKEKLDETVAKSASDQAGAGRTACMEHDYEAGLDQLRQAIAQLGKTAIR